VQINPCEYLVVDVPVDKVYVVRFTRPDLREQLCDDGDIAGCELFRQLARHVLAGLAPCETVVLNLGLVEPFPTAFFRYLLKVREVVNERKARLVLCRLSVEHQEVFELFQGFRLFQVTSNEAQALWAARAPCDIKGDPRRSSGFI
jgi:anti-anti-sigma regulatory factor